MPDPDAGDGLDQVQLRGLRFNGAHGVLPEERDRPQPFEVDVDVNLDLRSAGSEDRLSSTVDYGQLAEAVRAVVEGPHVRLLEALAEQIADGALRVCGDRARSVVVTVRKLRPPLPLDLGYAAVRICRP